MESSIRRIRRPVKREGAQHYLMLTLVSFAASVILIRLFLELSGYPQVGGGELHIAHLLWGGLLLFVASLLPLLLANRWVFTAGALSAGVGIGLFIDEVGKFITQRNDYFYPAAAPIIYAFFLLTVLLYLQVRRPRPRDARAELYRALESFEEILDRGLTSQERADLDARLQWIIRQAGHTDISQLARALRGFLFSEALYLAPYSPGVLGRSFQRVRAYAARWVTLRRLKVAVVGGLGVLGLGGVVSSLALLIGVALAPDSVEISQAVSGPGAATRTVPLESLELSTLVWVLGALAVRGFVSLLLMIAVILLIFGREQKGTVLGYFGLLLSLTIVGLPNFYFSQFGAVAGTVMQFGLLLGVIHYRRRYLISESKGDRSLSDDYG